MDNLLPFTTRDRLLVLAPHPDDEALATGGLLQRAAQAGASARIIFLTDGDNNPWPQRVVERRWRVCGAAGRARWGALRRGEALASLPALGHNAGDAEFWALPDQGLTDLLLFEGARLVARLCKAVAAWQPTWIAAPSIHDLHPDHSALGVAVDIALRRLIRFGQPAPLLLSYIVHGDSCPVRFPARHLTLRSAEVEAKRRAILCHRSQVLLSRRRFLAHARTQESFLTASGIKMPDAAHRVRCVRWDETGLRIDLKAGLLDLLLPPTGVDILAESAAGELRHICLPAGPREGSELHVPARFLGQTAQRVFIKLKTRFLLYAAGWSHQERKVGKKALTCNAGPQDMEPDFDLAGGRRVGGPFSECGFPLVMLRDKASDLE